MAAAKVTMNIQFTYRGQPEVWSQIYHVDGDFASEDDFLNTVAAIATGLKATVTAACSIISAYGYNAGDTHARYTTTPGDASGLPVTGTFDATFGTPTPGDVAATVRLATARRTSKGKVIYLRKYWHDVYEKNSGTNARDLWEVPQSTACVNFLTTFRDTGYHGRKIAGPDGVVPGAIQADQWLTTRTLKRRGKRRPLP